MVRRSLVASSISASGWDLAASRTARLFAAILAGLRPAQFARVLEEWARQLLKAELTLGIVLAMLNYSGFTATLGL
jgi:hypothetical protein